MNIQQRIEEIILLNNRGEAAKKIVKLFNPTEWMLLRRFENAHSYWLDKKSGQVAISETKPEDAILWVDPSRMITFIYGGPWLSLPILTEKNNVRETQINIHEARWIVDCLHTVVALHSGNNDYPGFTCPFCGTNLEDD